MNKLLLAVAGLLLAAAAPAQSLPYWRDMNVTSVNAQTQRTEVVYYASRKDALSKGFRQSENYLGLNGEWDFLYYEDWNNIPGMGANGQPGAVGELKWNKIQVPGNWEVQGWGIPIYTNHPYDFCPVNPEPPTLPEHFPAALYHRRFTLPQGWAGRQVFLNLCGSKSGTYVYVNGKEIGYCEDSKSLARFNITEAVHEGENEILLQIFRYSTGSYLECQDFWRISGLERDVYLSSEADDLGFDFQVVSTLDASLQTGLFKLKMRSQKPVEVFFEILDRNGEILADAIYNFCGSKTTAWERIPEVRRWTAETPELYTLLLRVNGEYTRFHLGFRRIEIAPVKDGEREVKALLVNGQPVKFKGVNLHEHNPYTGHYLTPANLLEDLKLMRLANINAIRTCHYPQSREFYELCDSLGFYVYDEANIESHGMGYKPSRTLGNNSAWYAKHLDRTLNLYYRTANYPCVTILSLGNEAGNGVNFYNTYKELKALEKDGQNRPVVYERAEYGWNTDMIVPQYPDAEWFRKMGEKYVTRPVCPSEYAHAMGNSTGCLDLQWEPIYAHKQLQGGFIWDWVDQGLYDAERGWTYGGDYGENTPSDNNFLCNGIVNPDRDPHPAFYEVKHVYQEVAVTAVDALAGIFQLQNRYYFKSLEGYSLTWWLERNGRKPWYWRRHKMELSTAPQAIEELKLKLPRMRRAGEYRIFFEVSTLKEQPLVAKGSIVAADEILIKDSSVPVVIKPRKGSWEISSSDSEIVIIGKQVEVVVDKEEGILKKWAVKGKDLVEPGFGIRPNFWRAPIDNDYGNNAPKRTRRYTKLGRPYHVSAQAQDDGSVIILSLGETVRLSEVWTLYPDGSLKVKVSTAPDPGPTAYRTRIEIPRLGFRFHVADDRFSYFGRGPVENYWDRRSGSFKRIWKSQASAECYPYVRPQETGHHTEVSWLKIGGITVLADEGFEFNALRQSVEDLDGELAVTRPYQWHNFSPDEVHDEDKSHYALPRQTHITDVPCRDFTEVCIDYHQSGVGGYDSWGARQEPAFTLWADQEYSYSFIFLPR